MSTAVLAPTTITMNIAGGLSTSSIVTMAMPFAGYINGVTVAVTTAPVGSALTADLLVGTGIAARTSVAAAGTSATGTLNTASYAVTNKALTSNVATLTTAAHGYKVGDVVTVAGVGKQFNGTHTITAVATTTTFAYASVYANVTSAASSGGTAVSSSPIRFVAGDLVSLDVSAVGSSTAGSNMTVAFMVEQA
jgi:hypothetical protein